MKKKSNLTDIIISSLPIIILILFYNKLVESPNTKISGNNGMIVSKQGFVFIIACLSILGYFISIYLSQRLSAVIVLISQTTLRVLVNLVFSVLSIVLILVNT